MNQEKIASTLNALNVYIREQNLSDFRIERLENNTLLLVGSFDLSYYHEIEIEITGVERLSLCCSFYVDLLKAEPFFICFPSEEIAVFRFEDCSIQQSAEIVFEGGLRFHVKHVKYET